ncbi:hypothetical protein EUX98_g6878 [Antrodiella citrinella]|uniref:F-box domain-containing protein n=1 Tax=Antrodiella citrinella TaxID=2447956 RepID=A0A4S4MVD5_9APHY|nr:hypothetical protein EUX98_g6878 [Antrodiella citrinella]
MTVDLPQELVEAVLQPLYHNVHSIPDYKTLSVCSMICKSWSGAAQKLLFYSIRLKASRAVALVSSPLEHTRLLVSSIRCLDLDITSDDRNAEEDLIAVITHCTGLYELTLRIGKLHEFDPATADSLASLASRPDARPLRAIMLFSFGTQSPIVYQLLKVWRTVQFVRLGQELAAPPPRTWTPTFHLYELTLLRVPTRNVKAIEWMLSASVGHLRILHLRDEPGVEYDDIFRTHGPHLESLRLYNHNRRTSTLLGMCPNLKELVITLLSSFFPLTGIPDSLEHLSFRNYDWAANESLYPIINAIDHLDKLRIVTCDANGTKHRDWSTLSKKCLERGVQLRADAPPIYVLEDPVPVKQYPRLKSVDNFAVMNNA